MRILITGATDGIGKATALHLAKKGNHLIIHGRNRKKLENTAKEIAQISNNDKIDMFVADFASLKEVEQASDSLLQKYDFIDVLINNAAVITPQYRESKDGIEMTFQVNYLSPFLLTMKLLPLLKKKKGSQIINVASIAHAYSMDFDMISNPDLFDPFSAYELSKLANILFTYKLADDLKKDDIAVNCLHPGVISTKLLHVLWGGGAPVQTAVPVITNVMKHASKNKISGKFFTGGTPSLSAPVSYDKEIQKKLWNYTLALLKNKGITIDNI